MPLAVAHVFPAIALLNYLKNRLSLQKILGPHSLFVAAVGALLPDIDIIIGLIAKTFGYSFAHGGYTHTLLFAFLFLLSALFAIAVKKLKIAAYFSIIAGGIILHLFLDYSLGGGAEKGIMWFFPFSTQPYKIHLLLKIPASIVLESFDALVLLFWVYIKTPAMPKT